MISYKEPLQFGYLYVFLILARENNTRSVSYMECCIGEFDGGGNLGTNECPKTCPSYGQVLDRLLCTCPFSVHTMDRFGHVNGQVVGQVVKMSMDRF